VLDDQPRPRAAEDGAVFAPVRVRGARRARILALLAVGGVGGLVAIGALDRGAAPPRTATVADATAAADAPATPAPTAQAFRSSRPPPGGSIERPAAGVIDLAIQPAGSHLFIHGDVFSLDVARVTVRLEDTAGNVAATTSVDIPGGSTAFRIGAVPRFDVHFLLTDKAQADGFMVAATALDSAGRRLTTLLQLVARSTEST
jgi:hypothetical protein